MNNKNNKFTTLGIAAFTAMLLLLLTTVYARGYDKNNDFHRGKAMGFFGNPKLLDQNGDGEITRAEADERINLIFSEIDSDVDGQVSEANFAAFNIKKAEEMKEINYHSLTDTDREKINERNQKHFSRLDKDSNGYLTKAELFGKQLKMAFGKDGMMKDGMMKDGMMKDGMMKDDMMKDDMMKDDMMKDDMMKDDMMKDDMKK